MPDVSMLTHIVAECWQELNDKDDRNSPADYPEMCLITRAELADYMKRAAQAAE